MSIQNQQPIFTFSHKNTASIKIQKIKDRGKQTKYRDLLSAVFCFRRAMVKYVTARPIAVCRLLYRIIQLYGDRSRLSLRSGIERTAIAVLIGIRILSGNLEHA